MKLENYCGGCGHQYTCGQNYCPECGLKRGFEEPEKPMVHPLDEMIDEISICHLPLKTFLKMQAEKLRYESIKWAWDLCQESLGDQKNTLWTNSADGMLVKQGKENWIID